MIGHHMNLNDPELMKPLDGASELRHQLFSQARQLLGDFVTLFIDGVVKHNQNGDFRQVSAAQ